jgi:hypothetical protein
MLPVSEVVMKLPSFFTPTQRQRAHWELLRSKGKRNFILRVGIIRWGSCMFLLMTASRLIRGAPLHRRPIDYVLEVGIGVVIWLSSGYLFGLLTWRSYEKRFADKSDGAAENQT